MPSALARSAGDQADKTVILFRLQAGIGRTLPRRRDLAAEADLSSPVLLKTWVRAYRREGADALRPKPKGRPRKPDGPLPVEPSELERLRRENERLRAEVAYLGKLRALRAQKQR